jgi:3-oxoacyl-[acyl-carrier-protein] synthase-1
VRGAISAVAEHPVYVDKAGQPMFLARDPELDCDPGVPVVTRLTTMLSAAIREAVGAEELQQVGSSIPCLICLPELRPGLPADLVQSVSRAATRLGFESHRVHVYQQGHAAGLIAMQAAARGISLGRADICVVAGVDSYNDADMLEWLDQNGMLLSAENRDGFPPGEGAGACLIASRDAQLRHGLTDLGGIICTATSFEQKSIRSEDLCIGEGLSAALRGATTGLARPEQAITATYCDLNGERYRNEEFAYALVRVQEAFVDAHDYQCPSDCWGDVGAASGPLFACLAVEAWRGAYAPGRYPILWAGSEGGHRAAVVLSQGQERP